jgi:hypothetical protein
MRRKAGVTRHLEVVYGIAFVQIPKLICARSGSEFAQAPPAEVVFLPKMGPIVLLDKGCYRVMTFSLDFFVAVDVQEHEDRLRNNPHDAAKQGERNQWFNHGHQTCQTARFSHWQQSKLRAPYEIYTVGTKIG